MEPFKQLINEVKRQQLKGFLAEAECLYHYTTTVSGLAPCLEVGSYCGKSTVFIGRACQRQGGALFAVDHHRGSEEHQLGEQYHDADLYDAQLACLDSLPVFRQTLVHFKLSDTVIPVVAPSEVVAGAWQTPLSLVFIDGGHSEQSATHDCLSWSQHVVQGGILAIHDIYPDPATGGQAPLLALKQLLLHERFFLERKVGSLVMLRRKRV